MHAHDHSKHDHSKDAPTAKPVDPFEQFIEAQRQLAFFTHTYKCATSRKARCEDLMSRKGTSPRRNKKGRTVPGWDPSKKAQMVRRLMTANQELNQCASAMEQLKSQIEAFIAEAKKGATAQPSLSL